MVGIDGKGRVCDAICIVPELAAFGQFNDHVALRRPAPSAFVPCFTDGTTIRRRNCISHQLGGPLRVPAFSLRVGSIPPGRAALRRRDNGNGLSSCDEFRNRIGIIQPCRVGIRPDRDAPPAER